MNDDLIAGDARKCHRIGDSYIELTGECLEMWADTVEVTSYFLDGVFIVIGEEIGLYRLLEMFRFNKSAKLEVNYSQVSGHQYLSFVLKTQYKIGMKAYDFDMVNLENDIIILDGVKYTSSFLTNSDPENSFSEITGPDGCTYISFSKSDGTDITNGPLIGEYEIIQILPQGKDAERVVFVDEVGVNHTLSVIRHEINS